MKMIHIESATDVCSVSVSTPDEILFIREKFGQNIHTELLPLFIQDIIKSVEIKDVVAISISSGPGSYTGLRIGLSIAKGLCYGFNIPLISINTLVAMANCFMIANPEYPGYICPMIDARRMEVYTMLLDSKLHHIHPIQSYILDNKGFLDQLSNIQTTLIGSGSIKVKELLTNDFVKVLPSFQHSSIAQSSLAWKKFHLSQFENLATFEPFYLKEFYTPVKQ